MPYCRCQGTGMIPCPDCTTLSDMVVPADPKLAQAHYLKRLQELMIALQATAEIALSHYGDLATELEPDDAPTG